MNICLFCWLEPIENFLFVLKDNLFELGWRFFMGLEKWYYLRGWHRFCVVSGIGLLIYSFIVTIVHWGRKE